MTTIMMRFGCSFLVSAFLFISACSQAFGQHMNVPGVPCNRPSSTAEEADCFARASDAADKELNGLYAQVRSVLNPEERNDLLEAQRAWLKYRDLTCTAEFRLYGGGTGGPVTQMACLAAITQERISTLRITYGWRLEK
jgi:uncharacterized protein YecT (DUF1311 family)